MKKNILVFHLFSLFHRDPNHLSVPYHYYEPLGPDECTMYMSHERGRKGSHHRFITEKRVFENWARTFNIHFFQPDWKPEPLTVNHPEIKPVVWGAKAQDHNHSHLLCQPLGCWTFWDSKAASGRRVAGFAVDHFNNSQEVMMKEQSIPRVLSVELCVNPGHSLFWPSDFLYVYVICDKRLEHH